MSKMSNQNVKTDLGLSAQLSSAIPAGLDMSLLSNRTALLTLFATCEEMILLAEKGQWERVSQLEARRSKELVDFFSAPMPEAESVAARAAILKLSELNNRLVEMATLARDNKVSTLKNIRVGAEARRQYDATRTQS